MYNIFGIIVFVLAVYLTAYALFMRVSSRVKYSLVFFGFCYVLWTGAYLFLNNSAEPNAVLFWYRIASLGFLAVPGAVGLIFIALAENENEFDYFKYLGVLALLLSVLYFKSFTGMFALKGFTSAKYGYVEQINLSSVWPWIHLVYFVISVTFGFLYYYKNVSARGNYLQKKHLSMIFFIAFSIMFFIILGTILFSKGLIHRLPFSEQAIGLIWIIAVWFSYIRFQKKLPSASILSNQIIDIIDDMLFVVNKYNNIVLVNPAVNKLLGYEKKELIEHDIALIFEQDIGARIKSNHDLLEILSPGSGKTKIKAKNGQFVTVSFSVTARSEKTGEISWIIIIFNDIREFLKIEKEEEVKIAELQETYHDLELTQLASLNIMEDLDMKSKELTTAYNDLKEAQERLLQTEKMAAIGKLAGGVAHEINNPMTVILGYAQSVAKRIAETDIFYKPLKAIEREALRSKRLIDDLLTYSRTQKAVQEEIDVNQTVESALTLVNALSKVRNIEVKKELAADLPLIWANKNQIQQIIINLSNNAMDAVLEMKESGSISIKTFWDKEYVNIIITDDGSGMDKETLKKIFIPFYTTKEVGKGTGLGLSLCYEIIQKHNGKILVESEVGKGSKFTVKLPVGEQFPVFKTDSNK
ncbi:MAG: hypothetical protein A2497_07745 [Candidatus Firestonebacteria bacterium RifOxyC12_full_39_7]|nr:MAG: hypothetical protein A2536_02510 [Candidatus Firestonebacteria bacterium RIFOXYD2_FULL_39_29]OGF56040.1 MAG: hypothetical protein A2497_07745 [Candidatus Firestonebacteria bacterium RifOxyC12_full_39_7]